MKHQPCGFSRENWDSHINHWGFMMFKTNIDVNIMLGLKQQNPNRCSLELGVLRSSHTKAGINYERWAESENIFLAELVTS
jgi:hypothetical protein